MNLMTKAVEYIYEHGNAILALEVRNNFNYKIDFYVGNSTGELQIKVQICDDDDLFKSINFNVKDGLLYIALLVYYSVYNYEMQSDLVKLRYEEELHVNSMASLASANTLYKQLISMLRVDKKHIEALAKSDGRYDIFANTSKYVEPDNEILSMEKMIKELGNAYDTFVSKLGQASMLWKSIGNGSNEEEHETAANNWFKFLNELDQKNEDLDSLDIDYDFLTSKRYVSNPAIDREEEIKNLEIALLTHSKSALLVGEPGVGKTAIVEGLAYKIITGKISSEFRNKKILKINTSSIVSGCTLVGMFEEKVEKLMKYLTKHPDIILFVDEMHTAIGAGTGSKDGNDFANILKPYLDRGSIKIIGATTGEEYYDYIKKDKAFDRRFKKITISEPKYDALIQIIEGMIRYLEKETNKKWDFDNSISDMIIEHIARCTDEKNRVYNDKRYNPDISIEILETAFAIARFNDSKSVTIEYISDAIKRSEFLNKSFRNRTVEKLLSKYYSAIPNNSTVQEQGKVIKFRPLRRK